MNKIRRLYLFFLLMVVLVISTVFLTGCQSTDKKESYFDTTGIEYSIFEYDPNTNQTRVIWATTLTNDTIWNFNSFSVTFNLYQDSILVKTETYNYDVSVRHGADYTGKFNFYADNEIDSIEYVSWTANYSSFWETYKIWFIVMISLASVASLIYIIVMIIEDLELSDTFDAIAEFFEDHAWVAFCILIPLIGGGIWGIVGSYWVPILIVLGGIIAFVLIALIAHLVKFIIESIADNISFGMGGGRYYEDADESEEFFDTDVEDIADYIDDRDKLMLFKMEQLKEYCRENGIKGYSSLNKSELVDLIASNSNNENTQTTDKKTTKHTSQKSSTITFDDIAGLEEAKIAFKEKVVYAFEHKDLYEKYGKKVGGGLLLYGLPGTGKTMFAEAASNETDSLFIPIKCSDIKSKWYGESEANVKKIFEKARKAKRAIIFFDEFEAIGAKRTDDGENGNNDLVPQILAEMQGVGSSNSSSVIMVIAATNKPWAIDSAFLRPGRFDEKIYIPLPDLIARKKLFELKLKEVPQENLDFDYLAEITEGFNGADIGAFCDKLKMLAISKSIETNAECPITMADVRHIHEIIKSSVSSEDVERLLEFKEQYS
ncbi:MAG: AAA family ATPase [Eubacteriales bacterium]|nr:AAA family ATPase [Christensenellaceae bacterium]MDY2750812.1 AAA family ATPase [Eubacteriales bacterium]